MGTPAGEQPGFNVDLQKEVIDLTERSYWDARTSGDTTMIGQASLNGEIEATFVSADYPTLMRWQVRVSDFLARAPLSSVESLRMAHHHAGLLEKQARDGLVPPRHLARHEAATILAYMRVEMFYMHQPDIDKRYDRFPEVGSLAMQAARRATLEAMSQSQPGRHAALVAAGGLLKAAATRPYGHKGLAKLESNVALARNSTALFLGLTKPLRRFDSVEEIRQRLALKNLD